MRTKYRVPNRDVYVGPISRMPDRLFENLDFTFSPAFLRQLAVYERHISRIDHFEEDSSSNDSNDDVNESTATSAANNNDEQNTHFPITISRPGYEVKLVTANKGFVKMNAGHMKQTFNTYRRSGKVRVLKGEMKVKCRTSQWKLNKDTDALELCPNTTYYAKNNSLRNECVFQFIFENENSEN